MRRLIRAFRDIHAMKNNENLFGWMLGISSILWLAALLSVMPVADKIDPFIMKLIVGEYDSAKMPLTQLRWKLWQEMYVSQIIGRIYLWILPNSASCSIPLDEAPLAHVRSRSRSRLNYLSIQNAE